MESRKPKTVTTHPVQRPIGGTRSVPNAACRKHPKHQQSPGVCSLCLTEKLVELSSARGSSKPVRSPQSSDVSSSSYLSSLSSSCASPLVADFARRAELEANRSSARVWKSQSMMVLERSRSMAAFVPQRRREADANGKKIARAKRGFWSKLLRRKTKGLTHSKTMNERVAKAVH